jgi:hypothetical protein
MQKPSFGSLIKPGHPLASDLVAHWIFNAGFGGTVYDHAPSKPWLSHHHGTILGSTPPTWEPSAHGGTLEFLGSGAGLDAYVSVPNSADFNMGSGDFTITFWAKDGSPVNNDNAAALQLSSIAKGAIIGYVAGVGNLGIFLSSDGVNWDIAANETMGDLAGTNWVHYAITIFTHIEMQSSKTHGVVQRQYITIPQTRSLLVLIMLVEQWHIHGTVCLTILRFIKAEVFP